MESSTYTQDVSLIAKRLRESDPTYWISDDFPWRTNKSPYRVFLAEFLLVRTRADLVRSRYETIATRYPSVQQLSEATEEQLIDVLRPLGLTKRAGYLLQAARYLMKFHGGEIPNTLEALLKIPGMGLYTSTAVMAFAFESIDVPADVNILRFLSRVTGLAMGHPTKGSAQLYQLLPAVSHFEGGPDPETLLDFTRMVCRPRNPKCGICPLSDQCAYSLAQGRLNTDISYSQGK